MKLSKRLETITELIPKCDCLADIGTDHAYIPIEAVRLGLCRKAIASDIGEGPILSARSHIADAKLADVIETRVGDGLMTVIPGEADVIVIAGMGGQLISDIIRKGIGRLGQAVLILSPQSELDILRAMLLSGFGYYIEAERCVLDEGKYYFIIKAIPREIAADLGLKWHKYESAELEFGRADSFDLPSLVRREEIIGKKLSSYENIIEHLRKAGPGSADRDMTLSGLVLAKDRLISLLNEEKK